MNKNNEHYSSKPCQKEAIKIRENRINKLINNIIGLIQGIINKKRKINKVEISSEEKLEKKIRFYIEQEKKNPDIKNNDLSIIVAYILCEEITFIKLCNKIHEQKLRDLFFEKASYVLFLKTLQAQNFKGNRNDEEKIEYIKNIRLAFIDEIVELYEDLFFKNNNSL